MSEKEEEEFLDKIIDKGIDVLRVIATNPAGVGLIAIGIGAYLRTLREREVTTKKFLASENRYRLSVEGIRLIYGVEVITSRDEFGIDLRAGAVTGHKVRIGRNFTAEHDRCQRLLAAGDVEFDSTCEVYATGPTTITKKEIVTTGYDPVIDIFPFEWKPLIGKEFGELYLSDALVAMGLLAIGGQAIGEIIPG